MPPPTFTSSYSDEQLLVAVQTENSGACAVLFDRFHRLLRAMVARRCPVRAAYQPDFVDDVVSQTFMYVLDPTIRRFDPLRGRACQYLYGLLSNAVRTIAGQRRSVCSEFDDKSNRTTASIARSAGVIFRNTLGSRCVPMPDHSVEARDGVQIALAKTDPAARQVISDHFFAGEEIISIATRLGVSHSTVSRRISGFLATSRRRLA